MNLLRKYRYFFLAGLGFVLIMYWLISGDALFSVKDVTVKIPNAIIKDSILTEDKKDGNRNWELTVDQIEIDISTKINTLTGVKGRLYREDGVVINVTSKGGLYNPQTRQVTLTGDVLASDSEGRTLKCQQITWLPGDNSITATGSVEFKKEGLLASGDKIETDRALDKIKITGNGVVKKEG